MCKKMTHTGTLKFKGDCIREPYNERVLLRETKKFFVSENGTKYRKKNGSSSIYLSKYSLDLESVKAL